VILGRCPFCHKDVETGERYYSEVLGWEASRKAGGTNALRLRSKTGSVAHWLCVDRSVQGFAGQQRLI